jgi:hypothetical protein
MASQRKLRFLELKPRTGQITSDTLAASPQSGEKKGPPEPGVEASAGQTPTAIQTTAGSRLANPHGPRKQRRLEAEKMEMRDYPW